MVSVYAEKSSFNNTIQSNDLQQETESMKHNPEMSELGIFLNDIKRIVKNENLDLCKNPDFVVDAVEFYNHSSEVCFDGIDPREEILIRKFIEEYSKTPLNWNLDVFRKLQLQGLSDTTLTEYEMIEIINKAYEMIENTVMKSSTMKVLTLMNRNNANSIRNYILMVFNTDYCKYKTTHGFLVRNLLGRILKYVKQMIPLNECNFIQKVLNEIASAVEHTPDGQTAILKNASILIHNKISYQCNDPYDFIRSRIAVMKEYRFNILVEPYSEDNSCILNYWTVKLKNILGFGLVFEDEFIDLTEKKYHTEEHYLFDALNVFLDCFTPNSVIPRLVSDINKNDEVRDSLIEEIEADTSLSEMIVYRNGLKMITAKAVEYVLLKMNILI